MTLGEKIREARRKRGQSQEQLAEKMSVSRSAVAKWETDKGLPDVGNLKTLSRLLGVSVDRLLDDSEEVEEPVLREPYDLTAYGAGCEKVKKDRAVREKFPDARICPLLGQQELPHRAQASHNVVYCGAPARQFLKNENKSFYLVEKEECQLFVTLTDAFIEIRTLEEPLQGSSFSSEGWNYIKCNYEIGD